MTGTRIEALYETKIPADLWPTATVIAFPASPWSPDHGSSPGGAGDPPATFDCRLDGGVQLRSHRSNEAQEPW